LILKLFK